MEHVVFHPGPDGAPAFRRFPSLEDAVRYVEHLRNIEGVTEVSVHALSAVPVSFRAYYRVEVPADEPITAEVAVDVPMQPEPVLESVPAEMPAEMPVEPVAEPQLADAQMAEVQFADAASVAEQPSNGKRSLGFFSH
jgi:hypothetical protein